VSGAELIDERTGGVRRRFSAALFRRPWAKLALLLGPPLAWMAVVYLGALVLMLMTAFWRLDPLSSALVRDWNLDNFHTLITDSVYRTITMRTAGMAVAVTITDIVLAFPLAYYAARMVTPRRRAALLLAVTVPLWSSYLVRIFAWKTILAGHGLFQQFFRVNLGSSNWAVWLTFVYLWLPFVILPIYAALERVPASYLEASGDLGARSWVTFRRVVLPLVLPGVVAGSIFAFSLTLGDYIVPTLVGKGLFIGNVVYNYVSGLSNQLPLGAAFALVPAAIMALYLLAARKLGAFEAL
jgi:putative spermidine/putrescine transport system permease protein